MYCNNCGKHNLEDSKFCKYCGSEMVRMSEEKSKETDSHADLKEDSHPKENHKKVKAGLGGWLAIVGIGLFLSVFLRIISINEYITLFNDGTFSLLTSPESDIFVEGYGFAIWLELLFEVSFFIAAIYLIYLYFKKKKIFPKYYVIFLAGWIVYAVLDYIVFSSITSSSYEIKAIFDEIVDEQYGEISRSIVSGVIWILYIIKSKQVKATFVNE